MKNESFWKNSDLIIKNNKQSVEYPIKDDTIITNKRSNAINILSSSIQFEILVNDVPLYIFTGEGSLNQGGTKKTYLFNLEYVAHATIGSYGPGNLYLFDWSKDTEYTQEYNYSKIHDDWILSRDEELLKYENDKEVNKLSDKYLIGVSGKRYPIKKNRKNIFRGKRKILSDHHQY